MLQLDLLLTPRIIIRYFVRVIRVNYVYLKHIMMVNEVKITLIENEIGVWRFEMFFTGVAYWGSLNAHLPF